MDAPQDFRLQLRLCDTTTGFMADTVFWLRERLEDLAEELCPDEIACVLGLDDPLELSPEQLLDLAETAAAFSHSFEQFGADAMPATYGELMIARAMIYGCEEEVQGIFEMGEIDLPWDDIGEDLACLDTLWLSPFPGDPETCEDFDTPLPA